jgi:hypothetical protein
LDFSVDSGLNSNSTVRSVLLIDYVAVYAKLASSLIPLSYQTVDLSGYIPGCIQPAALKDSFV